jgi:oligopeptide/dipeptide ABC transporter ATP-binding protein
MIDLENKTSQETVLTVNNLVKHFPIRGGVFKTVVGWVKAVDDISFHVFRGETFGLVGESGCGKTTAAMTLMRLYDPTSGSAIFDGRDILRLKGGQLRALKKDIQMIFQDPYSSLNPRMRVKNIIAEGIRTHHLATNKEELVDKVADLMKKVGLSSDHMYRFPHEFSGGQRQRIGIARALAVEPKMILCDEPVSALDVSIQAQVVNLLKELQTQYRLTYVFVAHDLAIIKHISDRIGVMYLGKMVEMTDKRSLFDHPMHPYTRALISAIPIPNPERKKQRTILVGDVPSPINPPAGCRFHTRCPIVQPICKEQEPLFDEKSAGHFVACHFAK